MRRLLLAVTFVILAFGLTVTNNALAQVQTQPAGQGPVGTTTVVAAIAATSTAVTLTAPSNYITIVNPSTSATVYFSTVSPATTSSFPILPADAYTYEGVPLSEFWVITSTGTVNVGVCAH